MPCPDCRIPKWCAKYNRCALETECGVANVGLGNALAGWMAAVILFYIVVAALVGGCIVGLLWWIFG